MIYLKRSLVVYIFLMISYCSECVARVTTSHGGTSSCIVNCVRVSFIHLCLGKVFPPISLISNSSSPAPTIPHNFMVFRFLFCFFAILVLFCLVIVVVESSLSI